MLLVGFLVSLTIHAKALVTPALTPGKSSMQCFEKPLLIPHWAPFMSGVFYWDTTAGELMNWLWNMTHLATHPKGRGMKIPQRALKCHPALPPWKLIHIEMVGCHIINIINITNIWCFTNRYNQYNWYNQHTNIINITNKINIWCFTNQRWEGVDELLSFIPGIKYIFLGHIKSIFEECHNHTHFL